jgi:hypothetical protein
VLDLAGNLLDAVDLAEQDKSFGDLLLSGLDPHAPTTLKTGCTQLICAANQT